MTPAEPARRGRTYRGAPPRWEILYEAMAELEPGEMITYERIGRLLNLDHTNRNDKVAIAASARRAAEALTERVKKVATIVRGEGYAIAHPDDVMTLARRHQTRAFAEVEAGADKVGTIDLSQLDATTARLVQATGMALARQAAHMRHLDIRQHRLETVMQALAVTVDVTAQRVAETSTRVDDTRTDLAELQQRITRLEHVLPTPADPQTS